MWTESAWGKFAATRSRSEAVCVLLPWQHERARLPLAWRRLRVRGAEDLALRGPRGRPGSRSGPPSLGTQSDGQASPRTQSPRFSKARCHRQGGRKGWGERATLGVLRPLPALGHPLAILLLGRSPGPLAVRPPVHPSVRSFECCAAPAGPWRPKPAWCRLTPPLGCQCGRTRALPQWFAPSEKPRPQAWVGPGASPQPGPRRAGRCQGVRPGVPLQSQASALSSLQDPPPPQGLFS